MIKKSKIISAVLIIGIFYFAFMILDRTLSLIYGFNFQPYGDQVPPGFTVWGHLFNGSVAALAIFITFKLYDYGKKRELPILQIMVILIYLAIGAIIPYMNDAAHLEKHGMGYTIPIYAVANSLYVFWWGMLTLRITKTRKRRLMLLGGMFALFLIVHFVLYAPRFPEFHWS